MVDEQFSAEIGPKVLVYGPGGVPKGSPRGLEGPRGSLGSRGVVVDPWWGS